MTPENKAQVVAAAPSTELRRAAQAVLDRWNSPKWEWHQQGPTADLMADLSRALAPTGGEAEQLQTELDVDTKNRAHGLIYDLFVNDDQMIRSMAAQSLKRLLGIVGPVPSVHLAASQSGRTSGEALGTVPSAEESGQ